LGEPDSVTRLYRLTPRRGGAGVSEGYSDRNVLASYVHLHFGSNPEVARHLVSSCRAYKEKLPKAAGNECLVSLSAGKKSPPTPL